MTRQKIAKVVGEMARLQERIKNLDAEMAKAPHLTMTDCPKETGAIRRSSMDLTRALADMRRYW